MDILGDAVDKKPPDNAGVLQRENQQRDIKLELYFTLSEAHRHIEKPPTNTFFYLGHFPGQLISQVIEQVLTSVNKFKKIDKYFIITIV